METKHTAETESALEFYDGYLSLWNDKITHKDFLREIILFCFANHVVEELHEIAFSAKYVTGLHRVLIDAVNNPEVKDTSSIEHDLSTNLQKVIDKLGKLLKTAPEKLQLSFAELTAMTPEAFQAFFALLVDFDFLKQYFNLLMREAETSEGK